MSSWSSGSKVSASNGDDWVSEADVAAAAAMAAAALVASEVVNAAAGEAAAALWPVVAVGESFALNRRTCATERRGGRDDVFGDASALRHST